MKNLLLGCIAVTLCSIFIGCSSKEKFTPAPEQKEDMEAYSNPNLGDIVSNSIGMKFVYIAPGEFVMGTPKNVGYDRPLDEIQHSVRLTKGYWLGQTPVTCAQFAAFVKDSGYETDAEKNGAAWIHEENAWRLTRDASWRNPGFEQTDDHPVVCISWSDAQAFCSWLSRKENKTYWLPTEAQWEYSCRAGTITSFYTGEAITTDQANFDDYTYSKNKGLWRKKTTPVKSFKPNKWGLYDMYGNVWEWCADWYGEYAAGPVTDPTGPNTGDAHVVRGGAWCSYYLFCRSAFRNKYEDNFAGSANGFRVVLDAK